MRMERWGTRGEEEEEGEGGKEEEVDGYLVGGDWLGWGIGGVIPSRLLTRLISLCAISCCA